MEPLKLTCPMCKKTYTNYREYFACWTGHLDKEITGKDGGFAPFDHAEAIQYYKENPERLEYGLRILAAEIGIFHGRIDLLGVDKEKNMVIIDVTNGHDPERKVAQLKKYRKNIVWMAKTIFGLKELPNFRLLIVKPNEYMKEIK